MLFRSEAAYEPFEYLDKDGETIIGYNADLFKEICNDLGVESFILMRLIRLQENLRTHQLQEMFLEKVYSRHY